MLDSLFIEQCKNPVVPTQIVKMIVQEESSKNPYSIKGTSKNRVKLQIIL